MPAPLRFSVSLAALAAAGALHTPLLAQDCAPAANRTIVRRFVEEAFNRNNMALFDTLVAADLRINGREVGREGFRESVAELHRTWADVRTEIRLMVAENDLVTTYLVGSGTQVGPFAGIPPTGRRVEWQGMTISRIRDGQIQERWSVFDWEAVLRQLKAPAAPGR